MGDNNLTEKEIQKDMKEALGSGDSSALKKAQEEIAQWMGKHKSDSNFKQEADQLVKDINKDLHEKFPDIKVTGLHRDGKFTLEDKGHHKIGVGDGKMQTYADGTGTRHDATVDSKGDTHTKTGGDVPPTSRTGKAPSTDNSLVDPTTKKPIDMVHPDQVDLPNGQRMLYGTPGSGELPDGKKDPNMIESVPLDKNGKPTGTPKQVPIEGIDNVLKNTVCEGKPGTSNPAVFQMGNGQVGMVFEVDKKNKEGVTTASDFYLATSTDGGQTFTMANDSKPVMSGTDKDPFISVPRVVKNATGDGYTMSFCDSTNNTLKMATSSDGQNWGTPQDIKVTGDGLVSNAAMMDPDVQTYKVNGVTHYRMLFTTDNHAPPYHDNERTTIWMADSIDGKTFTGAHQVVQPEGNAQKVMDAQVVTVDGKSYLQYVQVQNGNKQVMRQAL